MEIFNVIFGGIFVFGSAYFAYISCVLVSEKKARYRAGTHDYYDNPITEDKNVY
jgi:hypothetical protein